MKKIVVLFVLMLIFAFSINFSAFASEDDWKTMPVITSAYEVEKEKIYLEWEGSADLYQVYVDGKNVVTVNIASTTISLKEGTHQITVIPINYDKKDVDTNLDISVSAPLDIEGSIGIDLGMFGIDPKDIIQGTPSEVFKINYAAHTIYNATPEISNAFTDFDDIVSLVFTDNYNSDRYKITVKTGNDINYIEFDTNSEEDAEYIEKNNTTVIITLDPEFLRNHECMIPELNQKYSFTVKLQKMPENFITNNKEDFYFLESKEGKSFEYTPISAWKTAPEITYASQSSDGQVTLEWTHDDDGLGCEYKIMKIDKLLVVKTGETEIGRTTDRKYVIDDLMDGNYFFAIVPSYSQEDGFESNEAEVEVKNNWVVAPSLKCELLDNDDIILKWSSPENIDFYHITVYTEGDSLLRYLNLDYKKYDEFDIKAEPGDMEYTFTYDQSINSENGLKLKFEIYGIRNTANGEEQKSATTTQTIEIK